MSEQSWPELGAELGRKSLETVDRFLHLYNEGKLSERELWIVCDAVYDCMSGLAPWEDAKVIYAIRNGMSERPEL
jgi:hypothetical protein